MLRGYNVSGETKLEENNGLPFASVADAKKSATALRALGGGNSVRFLLSWAYAEPVRGQVDTAYLAAATAQMRAFLDAGIRVYPDFHQDLYSRYLFDPDSWYTGDGAPKWAVDRGRLPAGVLRDLPLLGPEHHPEPRGQERDVRLLAQRLRPPGRLPRHRPDRP